MTTLENLPEELKKIIFDYALGCKKEQKFYINKELTFFIINMYPKCKAVNYLGKNICNSCNNDAIRFFGYLTCAFI